MNRLGIRASGERAEWDSIEAAIAWGRRRAPIVSLRVDQAVYSHRWEWVGDLLVRLNLPVTIRHRWYSAGEKERPQEEPGEQYTRWPGVATTREADVIESYGGVVWLNHTRGLWLDYLGGYLARWEAPRPDPGQPPEPVMVVVEQAGPAWDFDIRGAIAWGRARAPIVLVQGGWDQYFSAGELNPPALALPEWDRPIPPRTGDRTPGERTAWTAYHHGAVFPFDSVGPAAGT